MILAVDAGNSRIKWGCHDGQDWRRQGWVETPNAERLLQDWADIDTPRRIVISNVAGATVRDALEVVLAKWTVPILWLTASAEQCGVKNRYEQPAKLGSDRWAALIGAWRRTARASVVVNAGTALTVDALSDQGEFLGGMIAPGLSTMWRSLAAGTAQLDVLPGSYVRFPRNTADALYSGALAAMAGVVLRVRSELAQQSAAPPICLIGGGDGPALRELLGGEALLVDNPVLDGLIEIAQE
ncbi:MAG: type III pantothenate kinase [Sulfuricella sp.]|nr:type III pantothenate kinase [Sulfuricella sp.]